MAVIDTSSIMFSEDIFRRTRISLTVILAYVNNLPPHMCGVQMKTACYVKHNTEQI